MSTCETCSKTLGFLTRADSRFCSSRCRTAAHRDLPAATLRSIDRWVRYSSKKVPLTTAGRTASATDAETWTSFDRASSSRIGVGAGFVLSRSDRIVCIDLDHCLDGRGRPLPWASEMLAAMPSTYVEVSPSGLGLHVWGLADLARSYRRSGVEVYGHSRYLTVTGHRWRKCPTRFAELGAWITSITGGER